MTTELFPKDDQTADTMLIDGDRIAAFDLDGERYCVECAQDMDSIDCERFHKDPYSVPYGGSVLPCHVRDYEHDMERERDPTLYDGEFRAHCGNSDCGMKLPNE